MQQVKLSPLNMHGFIAAQRNLYFDAPQSKAKRRIEEVTMYKCPDCGDLHDWEDDAEDCCSTRARANAGDGECVCPVCTEQLGIDVK